MFEFDDFIKLVTQNVIDQSTSNSERGWIDKQRKMVILFVILFGLLLYILWERRDLYRLSWQLPGPIGLPIVGNALGIASPESEFNIEFFPKKKNFLRKQNVRFFRCNAIPG